MAILDKIRLSGTTYDIIDATAIHSLDGYWTTGETTAAITAATNALAESIAEQGYQTSGDVQNAISGKADTTAVTQAISEAVSGKADTTAVTQSISEATSGKVDNDTYTAFTSSTDTALAGKANTGDVITSVSATNFDMGGVTNFLVTSTGGHGSTVIMFSIGSGFTFNETSKAIGIDTSVIAQKSDIPSVSGYADSVAYDTNSKEMKFYNGGTGGTEVYSFDASPFLIDGMVQNVEIKDVEISGETVTCLVVSFNTDAGKQDINIPLTDIFDASNYYTKTEVDAALSAKSDSSAVTEEISAAVSGKVDTNTYTAYTAATDTVLGGKADTTAMTEAISEATSGKVDNSTYTAFTSSTDTALAGKANTGDVVTNIQTAGALNAYRPSFYKGGNWNSVMPLSGTTGITIAESGIDAVTIGVDTTVIQEKLVSNTNIKTVGGNSLLGSGDIAFPAGMTAEVSGTTLVFS